VDLGVVLEVEALEVVRKQCFNFLVMLALHSSCTVVRRYTVRPTFVIHLPFCLFVR
jgi:hypothetical protein